MAPPAQAATYDTTHFRVDAFWWDSEGYELDGAWTSPGTTSCGSLYCFSELHLSGRDYNYWYEPWVDVGEDQQVFSDFAPLYKEPGERYVTLRGPLTVAPGAAGVGIVTSVSGGEVVRGQLVNNFVVGDITDDELRSTLAPYVVARANPCDALLLPAHPTVDPDPQLIAQHPACSEAYRESVERVGSGPVLLDTPRPFYQFLAGRQRAMKSDFQRWLSRLKTNPVPPSPPGPTAPTTAPAVSVTRQFGASGGFAIDWTPVPGATRYAVYRDNASGSYSGSGYLQGDPVPSLIAKVDSTISSYVAPAEVTADANLGPYSVAFHVVPVSEGGAGPRGTGRAGCAAGYFIAARGSGQNPLGGFYAHGLGHRGKAVYEKTRERLGLSAAQFQANAVNYPAVAVDWRLIDRANYDSSQTAGVSAASTQVRDVLNSCPSARVVLFGYSQGAHAIGDAFEALPPSLKSRILSVQLFADAKRRIKDPAIVYRPRPDWGMRRDQSAPPWHGILGSRDGFTGTADRQVMSWCWSQDDVCSVDSIPITFHGDQYDCYQEWAAQGLAAAARDSGWWPAADVVRPTCAMEP